MMEREYLFFLSNAHIEFLKKAAQRALIYWKSLEQKIPEKTLKKIDEMINDTSWYSSEQLNESIYEDIEKRLIRNSKDKNLSIKDRKNLKYPNYLYLLSNAATHEIIDIAISNKNAKHNTNNRANEDRFFNIIKRVYLSLSIGKK